MKWKALMNALVLLVCALVTSALFSAIAKADPVWVGPDCKILWTSGSPEELVQGYRVYVDCNAPALTVIHKDVGVPPTEVMCKDEGTPQEVCQSVYAATCSALNVPQGICSVAITAYNPVGESPRSNVVPFVLVTESPGAPGGGGAPSILGVESINQGAQ